MRESQTGRHFVGLDVGTSTIRCVVGVMGNEDNLIPSIVGYGSADNIGMRRGVVVHVDDVAGAISQAISEAERVSGIAIKSATVNINGSHVSGLDSKGVIAISALNREISVEDRLRVEEAAAILQLPPNREIIQVFAKNYRVDGQDNIKDPVGMHAVRLEVDTHIVTASSPHLKNLNMALEHAGISAHHHTVGSLAAAEAVLNRQQKESGTLLLDIGAGTTNLLVIEDGEVEYVAIIPMGGIHITNDLAIGLKTDLEIAEQVKIKHADLSKSKKGKLSIEYGGRSHSFDYDDVQMIVEARVEEILEYVDKELKKIQKARKLPGGVVIVGGTASLPGIDSFVRDKLELAARSGKLQTVSGLVDKIQDPAYVTATGLMMLDMLLSQHHSVHMGEAQEGIFRMITGFIGKVHHKS